MIKTKLEKGKNPQVTVLIQPVLSRVFSFHIALSLFM